MITLLRFLFIVQHNYRDPVRIMRATMLLRLVSGGALVLLLTNLLIATRLVTTPDQVWPYAVLMVTIALVVCALAALLVQRGHLRTALIMVGALLVSYHIADVLISGTMSTGAIFPMILIYVSLSYSRRGALAAFVYSWVVLAAMMVIRSRGLFGTTSLDNVVSDGFYTGMNISLAAWMLWLFTGSLQTALNRANRLVAQTRATAETGQVISRLLNVDELLTVAVDLIRDRFAFYHVQIFMVDDSRAYANLVASTGTIGQTLLSQGFRVQIGPYTLVSEAAGSGEMRYLPDTAGTGYHLPDLLSNTRTELVIPLIVGQDVVGVLDVYSVRPDAFGEDDIETMRILANQISQAIQNARSFEAQQQSSLQNRRLFLESETNLREIQRLNRQLTGQSWREYMQERGADQFGMQLAGEETLSGPAEWTSAMQQAVTRQRLVSHTEGDEQVLAVPISIRGQPVGAIEVRLPADQSQAEVRTVLQAVAERMAFSLENVRLFEQARSAAEREQQINQITAQLQGLTSIEEVLSTTMHALGQALEADQGRVRLVTLAAAPPDEAPPNGAHSTPDDLTHQDESP